MLKFFILLVGACATVFAKPVDIVLTENNSVIFNQAVSGEFASKKALEVIIKSKKASPLYIVLDTPGGSVAAGMTFIDTVKALGVPVHTITIFAASMGYQFVQELGTRYIMPSGTLMSHRGAVGGLSGQVPGELNSRLMHIQSVLNGMSERAANRISMTKKEYDQAIINELWVSGAEAVSSKQADYVANVRCDKSLVEGTYVEAFHTPFGSVNVTFSKCPLVSYPLSFAFDKLLSLDNINRIKNRIETSRRKINLTF